MNAPEMAAQQADALVALMTQLGTDAKTASAGMARASAAQKNQALRGLAAMLRAQVGPLTEANASDLSRARAAGLSGPMLDRLKLDPKTIETVAQGCEQLASMADVIGEIVGISSNPAAYASVRCACPLVCLA